MGESFEEEPASYPASLPTARQEAIEGIGRAIFEKVKPDAVAEDVEVTISADEVIQMAGVVLSSLEAQGVLRPRVNVVASDIPEIVDDIITVFDRRNLIETEE